MLKKFSIGFILSVMMLVLAACGGNDNDASTDSGSKKDTSNKDADITIGFSQVTQESPFYISLVEGAKEEAAKLGVELIVIDAQNDIEKQNADVQSLLTKGIDALILNPTNPSAVSPSMKAAKQNDVPVITVDRNTNDQPTAYVGRDNEEMGRLAGEKAVALLGGAGSAKGKIIELQGDAGGTVMMARHAGFHEMIEKEAGIEVIEGPYNDYIRAKAVTSMQDLLQAHPDVDLVYAHNDDMALGALQVLKQANLLDQVSIVGIDGLMEAIKHIEDGQYDATVLNDPITMGKLAVQTAVKIVKGEEVDKYIDGGTALVDSSNAGEYLNDEYDFAVME